MQIGMPSVIWFTVEGVSWSLRDRWAATFGKTWWTKIARFDIIGYAATMCVGVIPVVRHRSWWFEDTWSIEWLVSRLCLSVHGLFMIISSLLHCTKSCIPRRSRDTPTWTTTNAQHESRCTWPRAKAVTGPPGHLNFPHVCDRVLRCRSMRCRKRVLSLAAEGALFTVDHAVNRFVSDNCRRRRLPPLVGKARESFPGRWAFGRALFQALQGQLDDLGWAKHPPWRYTVTDQFSVAQLLASLWSNVLTDSATQQSGVSRSLPRSTASVVIAYAWFGELERAVFEAWITLCVPAELCWQLQSTSETPSTGYRPIRSCSWRRA